MADASDACDVLVVGGSAAGLAAALQIARQLRSVIVVDGGEPRNAPAQHMHGYLGRDGESPRRLVEDGRREVRSYGGVVIDDRVVAMERADDGRFTSTLWSGRVLRSRRVVLATGITDLLPEIDGLAEQWGRGVLHCPFCHGYEVRGLDLVQIVTHPMGLHPAQLFAHLAGTLTVVLHGGVQVDGSEISLLERAGCRVIGTDVSAVVSKGSAVQAVELVDGSSIGADAVVVGPRFEARLSPFAALGLSAEPHPSGLGDTLVVDPGTGETAAAGVYAAGNVTDPSQQVLHAAANGSRVGAMVSFGLAREELERTSEAAPI